MTAPNRFYRPVSEQDTQEGYTDLFLMPLTDIYKDMKHSYIVELKCAKGKESDEAVEKLRQAGIAQTNRYADSEMVRDAVKHTTLHKIVVVYRGMEMEMVMCEEV